MIRRLLLAALLLATLPATAATPPAKPAPAALTARLQQVLDDFLAANPSAPGVSATVICPRLGLDWSGAAGHAARNSEEPLTPRHTFRIASNTKTYVATAILRLAEQGRLSIDDSFGNHLTDEERTLLTNDGYDLTAITLRQVLSHTSGLDEHAGDPRYEAAILADPQHEWTRDEQVHRLVEWRDPIGAPGERYKYSDTGYVLLGGLAERMTGRNLGQAVHELVDYDKLGLRSTWWEVNESTPPGAGPRAHQYFGDQDTYDWNPSLDLYGGGGLLTDAHDLALFMRLLLKGQVLRDEASLAAMTGDGTPPYRLGLMCMELGGRMAWGHQGFWNTFAFHVPSLGLTVAGCVLDHFAANGRVLAEELMSAVRETVE
ncbi:MAG: serine hydrolase domain-containing protein [Candidatus Krumholzibacteriia bacterium]